MDTSAVAPHEISAGFIGLKLLAVGFLVLLNGFFVAAEFALVKIRDTQLEPLVREGHTGARGARKVISNLDGALSACQLGITLASLGLGWVGEPVFSDIMQPVYDWLQIHSEDLRHRISFVVGFSIITFLHIVVGELAPKSYAIQQPLTTSLWVSLPLQWFSKISFPFIWILNHAAMWILRRFGIQAVSESEMTHTHDELRLLVSTSQKHSEGTALGRNIILNAMDLPLRRARDVMRPRHEIVTLSADASMTECLDIAEKTRFSRFPLCEEGNLDKVRGVLHFKDLIAYRMRAKAGSDLLPVARKLVFVPPTARLEKVLQLLLDRKLHMAFVVDEYGGIIGMVTLENILEELVGQIQDEFDQEKPLAEPVRENVWDIQGGLPLHDLAELVGEPLEEEGIVTASGFVTHRLGGFPKAGDTLQLRRAVLTVVEADGRTISKMTVVKQAEEPGAGSH